MYGADPMHVAVSNATRFSTPCPFSAWDDVAGAKLDPEEVVKARKVETGYADKKPVVPDMLPSRRDGRS